MSQSLNDFFRQKTRRAAAGKTDWQRRKREWLQALDQLYQQVRKLLAKSVRDGIATLTTRQKTITEQHLGEYVADELILTVGDEQVVFSPRGRNVVGALGRVDVRGESGEATLVLRTGSRWSAVRSKYPQLRTVPLDANALEETLRSVMRK